jgi:hypothetical protein
MLIATQVQMHVASVKAARDSDIDPPTFPALLFSTLFSIISLFVHSFFPLLHTFSDSGSRPLDYHLATYVSYTHSFAFFKIV